MKPPNTIIKDGVEMRAVGQTPEELDLVNNLSHLLDDDARKFCEKMKVDGTLGIAAMVSVMAYWIASNYKDPEFRETVTVQVQENIRDAVNDWAAQL